MRKLFWIVALLTLALPFAVFGQQDATEEPEVEPIELPAVDVLSVEGDIVTAGSSTVFPVTEAMAELFGEEGFAGEITVDSIGTGAGFERFCEAGETDVSNASRAINDDEIAACEAIERTPIEFRVGTDALAVTVSSENDFATCLTVEQLGAIYSGAATTWDAVDSSFPAEAIQVFSPGTDSGTFDYFVEAAVEPLFEDAEDSGAAAAEAILAVPGIQLSEDDNVLVQGVEGSPYAIGYFGFAYYTENQEGLIALEIDEGDGCIAPNADSAEDNSYPLSRPLFIYSDATIMAEKPQVAAFISFYLTNANDVTLEVGYFPASVEALNEAKQAYLDAVGM
jgi:phosphate transport system substrate-binding protein